MKIYIKFSFLLLIVLPLAVVYPTEAACLQAPTPTPAERLSGTATSTALLDGTSMPDPQLIPPTDTPIQPRTATRTPRPTNTPPVIPPSADPVRSNWMVIIAILAVIVVLLGVWISWRRES